ncbi:glyoxalase [Pseudonocardia xishanensis]|uniref:Glyoxalase n=1 Tax=Pseudonocardia xishanensis TaxID=630995 RepID=A0ABP8S0A7_9PSEU
MTNTERTTLAATAITSLAIEVSEPAQASPFYAAVGLADAVGVRASDAPSTGFRGFTLSLVVGQPSTVDSLVGSALEAGATVLKPVAKSFWGYGGVVRAPDGTIVKVASSSKKETGPATRRIDDVVLLLGVEDVKAATRFYVERGLSVAKSFGGRYAEFDTAGSPVKLALYGRRAAAKDAGVDPAGSDSHRLVVIGSVGPITDLDGFVWEAPAVRTAGGSPSGDG